EGVEKLLLDALLALDELDVVDEKDIDVPVTSFEGDFAVIAERVDEVVGELFGGNVLDPHTGEQTLGVVPGGMKQVSLAEAGFAPNEQGVVGPRWGFGDRERSGVSKPIRGADDEGVECVALVQVDAFELPGVTV